MGRWSTATMENSSSLGTVSKSVVILSTLLQAEVIGALCSPHTSPRVPSFIPVNGLELGYLLISVVVALEILTDHVSGYLTFVSLVLWFRVPSQQHAFLCHPTTRQL